MTILGIDPGTTRIGFGTVRKSGHDFQHISSGLLRIREKEQRNRLVEIENGIEKVIYIYKPDLIGLEKIFFLKNKKTGMLVAEARGVILMTCAKKGVMVKELTPLEVKCSLGGGGKASKSDVSRLVGMFLNLDTRRMIDDVTDALAIAIAASSFATY